jgi:hypothetical protein
VQYFAAPLRRCCITRSKTILSASLDRVDQRFAVAFSLSPICSIESEMP